MRFSKLLTVFVLAFCLALPGGSVAKAAIGVTSVELQDAASIIVPSGGSLGALDGFSNFSLQETKNISGGISVKYMASLLSNPWSEGELPELKIITYVYSSQEAAEAAFDSIASAYRDTDDKWVSVEKEGGYAVDPFGLINAEYLSFHLVHSNGNLLYQASIYREDGKFDADVLTAYARVVKDTDGIFETLKGGIESMKLALGILFPPTDTELSTKSEKSSLNLSSLYSIPKHGSLNFDLYIGEADGALGTIVDSSGIDEAEDGDMYLYIDKNGRLLAGIYAPDFDANCTQQSGWYRVESSGVLNSYEWNSVSLHYGVGGFWVDLNGERAECSVSQPRSDGDLFFGDYPYDGIEESMIGYVEDFEASFSTTSSGLTWDDVLSDQLFLDLPNADPDVEVFQFLKEEGIFTGSNGMLYPDNNLNRAEMVKILLRSYDYTPSDGGTVSFWDVPADAWYLKYLVKAISIGMVEGNPDGSFAPAGQLNRAEFYTMLYRIAKPGKLSYKSEFLDVGADDWYVYGAAFALSQGLLDEKYFHPTRIVTRRAAAQALYTLLQ